MVSTIRKAKEGVKRRAEATIASYIAINPYHTERKSGLGSISLVIGYNATSITKQTKVDIERVFGKSNVATIAYDNGAEFSSWPCRLRKRWLQIFTLLTRINPASAAGMKTLMG